MKEKKYLNRFRIFIIATVVFIGVVIWQYSALMLVKKNRIKPEPQLTYEVERGPILDRNGKILAIQTRLYSVTAWTPSINDTMDTAERLSSVLHMDKEDLVSRFESRNGFLYIKRKITPRESRAIEQMKELGYLTGITLEAEYGRNYPEKELAAHLLGYVGTDNFGLSGVEYTFDSELSPAPGVEDEGTVYGNQVFLTIDLNVQYFAEEIAQKAFEKHNADSVMILIMEAKTGDILGYVSKPSFDPNTFAAFTADQRINRPISFAYEPGSVFKVFSLSSFLDLGFVSLDDHFFCNGYYEIVFPNLETERINCLGIHGDVTLQTIIRYSCNAGAAYASEKVESMAFYDKLRSFGFGSPTGLPLSGESHGILSKPGEWSFRSKPTLAMGQEISVSGVQVLSAATVFANEGILLQPNIIKKIVSADGRLIQDYNRKEVKRVLSASSARTILDFMETATFPGGTAFRVATDGIRISAKTGTAQVLDTETGKYSEDVYIASCLALFPTDDPEVIVYIVIENPKAGEHFGGRIAAPIVHNLAIELIPYLGIPREGDRVIVHPGKVEIEQRPMITIDSTVPDFSGYSKKDILPLMRNNRVKFRITGEGWVVHQEPPPGTAVQEGMTVYLEFE